MILFNEKEWPSSVMQDKTSKTWPAGAKSKGKTPTHAFLQSKTLERILSKSWTLEGTIKNWTVVSTIEKTVARIIKKLWHVLSKICGAYYQLSTDSRRLGLCSAMHLSHCCWHAYCKYMHWHNADLYYFYVKCLSLEQVNRQKIAFGYLPINCIAAHCIAKIGCCPSQFEHNCCLSSQAGFWGRVDWPKLPSYPMFCKSFQSIAPPSLSKCKCCHCHRLQAASAGFSTWRLQLPGLWILQCAATGLWGILRRRWTCEVKTWRGGNYWKVVSSVSPTDECQGKMLGAIQQPQKITPVELKLKWLRASVNFVGNFFSGL